LLIGVILTGEKTSSLLTLFSIITFSIFRFNFYKNIIALLFSLFIFVCSFFLLINTNKMYYERIWIETNRIIPIFNNRTFIDSEYGLMIVTAYNIWLDNRIFGVGLKNYRSVCADNKYSNINSLVVQNRCSTHPHNFYAELLSELGLSGLLLFLSIIIKLFYDLINIYFTNKDYFLLSFIIILFFIFLPISLSSSLFNNFNILWISYIISLTIYISKNKYVI